MNWESPFASGVAFVMTTESDLASYTPHAEESALLHPRAVESRRKSFALGRAAASAALRRLGVAPVPVLRGGRGQPLWPEGLVGSIAHAGGYGVATVARREQSAGVGVDMEAIDRSLNQDIARRICGPEELGWVEEDATARHQRLLQLFSAKEAVYKAFYPLEEVFLGFLDVTLLWKADHFRGLLHKRVAADFPAGSEFTARAVCRHGMVLSAVQLPPAGY